MKTLIISIELFILITATSFAQRDTTFPMETCRFDLTYDSTKNIVDSSGFYIRVHTNNIYGVEKVLSLNDTGLVIRKNSNSLKLKVNDIKSVKFYDGTKSDKFMLAGALIGFAGIIGLYSLSGDSSFTGFMTAIGVGVVVAIPCAVIGAIAGLFFEDTQSYDLTALPSKKKKAKLIRLFRQHRD